MWNEKDYAVHLVILAVCTDVLQQVNKNTEEKKEGG